MSFAPGIIMTPLSSMLEASNAGHMNPEPITTRWMRGITWRMAREVIFGIGLNQMSGTPAREGASGREGGREEGKEEGRREGGREGRSGYRVALLTYGLNQIFECRRGEEERGNGAMCARRAGRGYNRDTDARRGAQTTARSASRRA